MDTPGIFTGLTRSDLLVLQQLHNDTEAFMPYRGCDGMAERTGLDPETVRGSLDTLQLKGVIRRWYHGKRLTSIEIVPTKARLLVEEKRGGRRICCAPKKVSCETIAEEKT
jgi:hypothetical protein